MVVPIAGQKRLVIVGASDMVGGYALRYAIEHPAVGRITAIGRKTLGISDAELTEVGRFAVEIFTTRANFFPDRAYREEGRLQNEDTLAAVPGEQRCGSEPAGAGANHDRVVTVRQDGALVRSATASSIANPDIDPDLVIPWSVLPETSRVRIIWAMRTA